MTNREILSFHTETGWELVNETPSTFEFEKSNAKIGIHILILFFLPILGNLAYHFMSKKKKTVLKEVG